MVNGTSAPIGTAGKYNPLYDPATDNLPIAPDVQAMLNQPMVDPAGFDPSDETFIYDVVGKFESGVIQRYAPSSLLKTEAYEKLDDAGKGKADQNAFNMLTTLRNLYDEWKANPVPTFQIKEKIHEIRMTKERLERDLGDVYVI